jgi:hypothetical protein
MTEEFMNIFEKIGKTPFEDKMTQTIESFESMVHLFMDMPEKIDNRLDSIQAQINSLEVQISILVKKVAEIQVSKTANQQRTPRAPIVEKVSPAVANREVMNELRDLIEKRKKKFDDK